MTPRRFVWLSLLAVALALVAAKVLRGRAEWSPPPAPAEPGTLSGR
jgi:hypothetical protein